MSNRATEAGKPRFRAEHVGSLLRPPALKAAYRAYAEKKIGEAELSAAVDRAVIDAIRLQEECGMEAVNDGEFRRASWFMGFVANVSGLSTKPSLFRFAGDHGAWDCPYAHATVERKGGVTTHEFDFVKKHTTRTPKITMPAPSALLFFRGAEAADRTVYPDAEALHRDLVEVYKAELRDLASRGCTYVQLDEVPLAMLCDPAVREAARARGDDPAKLIKLYVDLINRVLEDKPAGMTIGLHLCRGNYKGQWMAAGGYAPVADELFGRAAVDAFFLEYDSERAGDFAPLAAVPATKAVVLGLISTKTPESPSPDDLVRRVESAARVVPVERLAVSPQCGFASSVGGNPVTVEDQRRKLGLVAEVARRVWSR